MLKTSIKTFPAGYQQLQYIQSDGSAYMDPGVKFGSDIDFEIKLSCEGMTSSSTEYGIFGAYEWVTPSSGSRYVRSLYISINNVGGGMGLDRFTLWLHYGDITTETWTATLPKSEVHTLALKNKVLYLDGEEVKTFTQDISMNTNGYIFAVNGGGSLMYKAGATIHYLKLWKAGKLIGEYYPMRRSSDGAIGFYDSSKPENPFVGSADPTQTFTAGPNVGANTVRRIYTKCNISSHLTSSPNTGYVPTVGEYPYENPSFPNACYQVIPMHKGGTIRFAQTNADVYALRVRIGQGTTSLVSLNTSQLDNEYCTANRGLAEDQSLDGIEIYFKQDCDLIILDQGNLETSLFDNENTITYTINNALPVKVKKIYTTSGGHKESPVLIFESEE